MSSAPAAANQASALPSSALVDLASSLDSSNSDIPSFLNSLLAPLLPPSLPSSQPVNSYPHPPQLAPIDKQLNELLTQLSLLSQDTSSAVEQNIHDVSRTVPRLAYDLQFMRESANGLSSSLSLVQDRVARQTDLTPGALTGSLSSSSSGRAGEGKKESTSSRPESDGIRTHKALEKLTQLDKLKNRLESARDILREAESWSTLESELTNLISNAEYTKAGSRLHEASRSMVVFQNTPVEYEDRRKLLISLQNQLETSVSAALKQSLEENDVQGCAKFWEVFVDMDREEEFRGYYFKAKRASIEAYWKDPQNSILEVNPTAKNTPILNETTNTSTSASLHQFGASSSSSSSVRFSTFLPQFYSLVMTVLREEAEQMPQIFPPETASMTLATFISTTFDSLDPSFSSRLSSVTEHHGPEALPELIKLFSETEAIGVAIQGLLDKMAFNTQGGLLSGSGSGAGSALATSPATMNATGAGPAHSTSPGYPASSPSATSTTTTNALTRTSSKRMSISHRFSRASTISGPQATPTGTGWETTLYEPFLDLQSTYATLERRYLEQLLRSDLALQAQSRSVSSGSAGGSGSGSGKEISRLLVERTTSVLSRAGEAVDRCRSFTHGYGSLGLVSALEAYVSTFLDFQQSSVLEQIRSISVRSRSKDLGGDKDELDFEGLDYSTEDWGSFQSVLHVLESCLEISTRLDGFEKKLDEALREIGKVLKATPGEGYDTSKTTWGSILLLQQSTLNSADLHSIVSNPIHPILPISSRQLKTFTKTCQLHIQSIILSPLVSQLETYPLLGVWSKPDKVARKGELHVPTFSLSPTDVISRVSEGLLDLLRVFEVWSNESGLGWSLGTLPYINEAPSTSTSASASETTPSAEPTSTPITHNPPPETVLSTWISSLSLTLLSHLTSTTLPSIKSLTSGGQAQLKTDLSYLGNAVGALDVHWEELSRWERAVGLDETAWRKEMRDLRGSEGEGEDGEREREVVRRVGWMRGWV